MTDSSRPQTVIVLAMSADGKISTATHQPARFGSGVDRAHLEAQIAEADAVLIGSNTLRAYQTSLTITNPRLLERRQDRGQPSQPLHLICSHSGKLDPTWRFFAQPIPRGLVTTAAGAIAAQDCDFDCTFIAPSVLATQSGMLRLDWSKVWPQFQAAGIKRLAVLGGGSLVASLGAIAAIDELWLTVCPYLIGSQTAPTPYDGTQAPSFDFAQHLELLNCQVQDQEVFLHYRVVHPVANRATAAPQPVAETNSPPVQSPPQME